MKIVRESRFDVTEVGLANRQSTPLPPQKKSKIADLDRVFKVGLAKYPPSPKIQK